MIRAAPARASRRTTPLGPALALLWLLAGSAQAAASDDDEAAQQAAQAAADVVDLHCADVVAGRATESAEALAAVSPVLAQVSRAHDASGATYLLFWRGLLNACVGQEGRGVEDLEGFLASVGDDPAYAAQVTEAQSRLRRLKGEPDPALATSKAVPGIVAGGVLLGTGGVLAGLSGWQGQITQDAQAEHIAGSRDWVLTDEIGQRGEEAATASNALLAASIGTGVAGAVVIAVAAATGKAGSTVALLAPLPEGGVALQLWGQW